MTWLYGRDAGHHAVQWCSMTREEEAEVLAVLVDVGYGLTAHCEETASAGTRGDVLEQTFAGNIAWTLSNGWRVVVFNDCVEWDYIDRIEAPDGRWWEYPTHPEIVDDRVMSPRVANWTPTTARQKRAWLDQRLPVRTAG